MDLADLKRRAEAAREIAAPAVRGMSATLRLPTDHEVQIEAARCRVHDGADDPAALVRVRRALLCRAVVAWSGVTAGHLVDGAGSDAVEASPAAAALLFDAQPDVADAWEVAYVEARVARIKARETAEKN